MLPVLIVEPHAALRVAMASVLGRAHLSCRVVANTADAMLQLRDRTWSHIVVDVDSDEDMTTLCNAIAGDSALLSKLIVISEGGDTPAAVTHQPHLLKPFDTEQLLGPLLL